MYRVLIVLVLLFAGIAHAAKVPLSWKDPTTNTDGTPLKDLKTIKIEWGTCKGALFDQVQSSITYAAGVQKGAIYPTALSTVCIRAFSINSAGTSSDPTPVIVKSGLLPSPGKPVTLTAPVILGSISTREVFHDG